MTSPIKTGKEKLIEQLLADGIRYMFGNPGTVEQGFLDAIGNYPDFRYIACLHESVAVAMADGYARKSLSPAVVQLHSGVGLGNGLGMLYQALRGHAPLVVLAGEAGVRYDAMDAQMACDLATMARPVVKWAGRALHQDSLLRLVRRAVKIARTPPMGPVFLALPMDVLDEPNHEPAIPTPHIDMRTAPEASAMDEIAAMLLTAERPIFIVGDGVSFSGARAELEEAGELVAPEVWGADQSVVNFSRKNPCYQGELGHMFGSASREKIKNADAVLLVGTYVFPEVFPELESPFAAAARVAHIDADAYEIAKNHPVDLAVAADPLGALRALNKALRRRITPSQQGKAVARLAELARRRGEQRERAWNPPADDAAAAFVRAVRDRIKDEGIVFDEALTASPYLNAYFEPEIDGTWYQTRGGSLGVGIPGAMGIKLAAPEKTVIGFTGDGGSLYTIQALHTARRYCIGAKFVVCNNGRYRLLENNIDQYWRERGITPHAYPDCFQLEPAIDFVGLSKSLGVDAVRVTTAAEVPEAVERCFHDPEQPFLVELATGR